jgi:dolichol-phosphate mannosyltransferase
LATSKQTLNQTLTRPALTIVVPTYNERANVRPLVRLLDAALPDIAWEVVFVDDDSPDGTAEEVRDLGLERGGVRVIHRIGRRGLAGACIEGILSSAAPLTAVMDADLQHDEAKLGEMFAAFQQDPDLDLVIGSRNVEGGSSGTGLSSVRKWGSGMATRLAQKFLRITANDPMSGFFMVKRESFNSIVLGLQQQGFKILADMLSASQGKWNVLEVPYVFRERQFGESKMDGAVTLEFLGLIIARATGGFLSIRFILFMIVGFSGIFVQLGFVWGMLELTKTNFLGAQTMGVFAAMTTNFLLNNVLTYRDRSLSGINLITGLISFYFVCSIGAIANIAVADAINGVFPVWALASIVGALIGAVWNFLASALITWRAR